MFYSQPTGTGGAGMSGLLSGLIAGQQSRESTQRMDMLQSQFDQQQDGIEKSQFNEKMYNIREIQKNGGSVADSLVGMNKWMGESKNFAEEPQFNVGNWDNFKEDGVYTNAGINKIQGDTGKDFVAGESDKNNPIMLGDKLFDFDTFGAGASNFQTYAKEKDLSTKLQQAQVYKTLQAGKPKAKDASDAEQLNDVKNAIKYYEDNNLEVPVGLKDQQDILETKTKISKPQAIDAISSMPFKESINNWRDGGGELNQDTRRNARKMQNRAGYKFPEQAEVSKEISGYGAMNDAKKKVFQILDSQEGTLTGVVQEKQLESLKKLEDWKGMDKDAKQKAINSVFTKSTLGTAVSNYLKAISGSAVAEEEYTRIFDALTGGEGANPETIKAALGGSVSAMRDSAKASAMGVGNNYPMSQIEIWDSFLDAKDRKVNAFKDLPKAKETGGTMTTEQGAAKAPVDIAETAIDQGSAVIKAIEDKIFGGDSSIPKDLNSKSNEEQQAWLTKNYWEVSDEERKYLDSKYYGGN